MNGPPPADGFQAPRAPCGQAPSVLLRIAFGVGLLGWGSLPIAGQQPAQEWVTTTARTMLRERPALEAAIVVALPYAARLVVLEHLDPWVKVRVTPTGKEGWLRASQIRVLDLTASPLAAEGARVPDGSVSAGQSAQRASSDVSAGRRLLMLVGAGASKIMLSPELAGTRPQARYGATGGLALRIGGRRRVSLETGAMYVLRGTRLHRETTEGVVATSYVQVPLLVRIRIRTRTPGLAIFAGPFASLEVYCEQSLGSSTEQHGACGNNPGFADRRKLDYGATIGVGVKLGRFEARGTYDRGLRALYRAGESEGVNSAVMLLIGVAI